MLFDNAAETRLFNMAVEGGYDDYYTPWGRSDGIRDAAVLPDKSVPESFLDASEAHSLYNGYSLMFHMMKALIASRDIGVVPIGHDSPEESVWWSVEAGRRARRAVLKRTIDSRTDLPEKTRLDLVAHLKAAFQRQIWKPWKVRESFLTLRYTKDNAAHLVRMERSAIRVKLFAAFFVLKVLERCKRVAAKKQRLE